MRAIFAVAALMLLVSCATTGSSAPDRGPTAGPTPAPAADRVITPVLVEILHNEPRTPRNGGSAVVLLAPPNSEAARNRDLALCHNLFQRFDQRTTEEVAIGVEHGAEGELALLRPIYWLVRGAHYGIPADDPCLDRMRSYDFPRRDTIARKYNLRGEGPYLVVEQSGVSESERVAAIVDLSNTPVDQIDSAVDYFRTGFMQRGDVWNPEIYAGAHADGRTWRYVGEAPAGFLPQLIRAAGTLACPLTNLLDVCSDTN
jgi:hypothetical protein